MAVRSRSMQALSLCSGIGGIDLGLAAAIPGYCTVCYVERDVFCASVLVQNMEKGRLDDAPIWDDLKTFDPKPWRGAVDIVHGGFPCQPFSLAGKRKGRDDPRHLWPHIARIVNELRPKYAFFENVLGLVSSGLRDVCADLRSMGYNVSAGVFSADECGAPHVRKRLIILASNADGAWKLQQERIEPDKRRRFSYVRKKISDLPSSQENGQTQWQDSGSQGTERRRGSKQLPSFGKAQSRMGREAPGLPGWMDGWEDGVERFTTMSTPTRIDALRALGNAVVPATVAKAWRELLASA